MSELYGRFAMPGDDFFYLSGMYSDKLLTEFLPKVKNRAYERYMQIQRNTMKRNEIFGSLVKNKDYKYYFFESLELNEYFNLPLETKYLDITDQDFGIDIIDKMKFLKKYGSFNTPISYNEIIQNPTIFAYKINCMIGDYYFNKFYIMEDKYHRVYIAIKNSSTDGMSSTVWNKLVAEGSSTAPTTFCFWKDIHSASYSYTGPLNSVVYNGSTTDYKRIYIPKSGSISPVNMDDQNNWSILVSYNTTKYGSYLYAATNASLVSTNTSNYIFEVPATFVTDLTSRNTAVSCIAIQKPNRKAIYAYSPSDNEPWLALGDVDKPVSIANIKVYEYDESTYRYKKRIPLMDANFNKEFDEVVSQENYNEKDYFMNVIFPSIYKFDNITNPIRIELIEFAEENTNTGFDNHIKCLFANKNDLNEYSAENYLDYLALLEDNYNINVIPFYEINSYDNKFADVCYGDGKFVAVGFNDIRDHLCAYSTDGINWTQGTMPSSLYWSSVFYCNGMFVATNMGNTKTNIFAYSTDGINWTEGTLPVSAYWYDMCYGNDKFVLVGSSFVYSYDGINWVETDKPDTRSYHEICYGNNMFLTIPRSGYKTNTYLYSYNGIDWIEGDISNYLYDSSFTYWWYSICYGNGKFYAQISSNWNVYSTDGISWNYYYMDGSIIRYMDNKLICIGGYRISYSYDGSNNRKIIISTKGAWHESSYIAYGNGLYLLRDGGDNKYYILKFTETTRSEKIKSYNPISIYFDFNEYIESKLSIRKYKFGKLLQLISSDPYIYSEYIKYMDKITYNINIISGSFNDFKMNTGLTNSIQTSSSELVMDDGFTCVNKNDDITYFTEPHTYIKVHTENPNAFCNLYINGKIIIPTLIKSKLNDIYLFIPQSVIKYYVPGKEYLLDYMYYMQYVNPTLYYQNQVTIAIYNDVNRDTDNNIVSSFVFDSLDTKEYLFDGSPNTRYKLQDLVIYNNSTGEYIPLGKFDITAKLTNATIEFDDGTSENVIASSEEIVYLGTNLNEYYLTKDNARIILGDETTDYAFPNKENNYNGYLNKSWKASELEFALNDPLLVGSEITIIYSPTGYTWDIPIEKCTVDEESNTWNYKLGAFIGKNDINLFELYIDNELIPNTGDYLTLPDGIGSSKFIEISIPRDLTRVYKYDRNIVLIYNPINYSHDNASTMNTDIILDNIVFGTIPNMKSNSDLNSVLYPHDMEFYAFTNTADFNSQTSRAFVRTSNTSIYFPFIYNTNNGVWDLQEYYNTSQFRPVIFKGDLGINIVAKDLIRDKSFFDNTTDKLFSITDYIIKAYYDLKGLNFPVT